VLSPGRLRGVRNWLQARVLPNKPLKLTTAGFSRAGGRARHETRQDPARPQLSGHPLGGMVRVVLVLACLGLACAGLIPTWPRYFGASIVVPITNPDDAPRVSEEFAECVAAIASAREVWPDLSEPDSVSPCSACARLRERLDIRLPGQLRRLLQSVRTLIEGGELRVLPHGEGPPDERPFAALSEQGPWPDVLNYRFQCNQCGTYFALSAETCHGSRGEWRSLP